MKSFYVFSKTHQGKNVFLIGYSLNGQPCVDILHQDHALKYTNDYLLLYTYQFLIQHNITEPVQLICCYKSLPTANERIKKWSKQNWATSNLTAADIYARHQDTGKPVDDFYQKMPKDYISNGRARILKMVANAESKMKSSVDIKAVDRNNPAFQYLLKYARKILGLGMPRYRVLSIHVSNNTCSQFKLICHRHNKNSKQVLKELVNYYIRRGTESSINQNGDNYK